MGFARPAEEIVMAPTAALPADKAAASSGGWFLTWVHVEGLQQEDWIGLPQNVREIRVSENTVYIGRQHQPHAFEALLARVPHCLSFISRTHVQVEASASGISATNLSSNPVYVDREPLAKDHSRMLTKDQVLSFARLEGRDHVLFLSLQVQKTEGGGQGEEAALVGGSSAVARKETSH